MQVSTSVVSLELSHELQLFQEKKKTPWRAFCPMTHERRRKVIKNGSWKCRWGMCYDFLKRLKPFQMNKAIQIPWRQKSYKNWLSWLKAMQKCDCVVKEPERVRNSNKSQVRGGIKYNSNKRERERTWNSKINRIRTAGCLASCVFDSWVVLTYGALPRVPHTHQV